MTGVRVSEASGIYCSTVTAVHSSSFLGVVGWVWDSCVCGIETGIAEFLYGCWARIGIMSEQPENHVLTRRELVLRKATCLPASLPIRVLV